MTIEDILRSAEIDRLDVEVLISHVLQKPRTWVIAHGEFEVSQEDKVKIEKMMERRKNHEPIAYITNTKEFYGRDFYVDSRVLIPRPCTERLVDIAQEILDGKRVGSGEEEIDTEVVAKVGIKENCELQVANCECIVDIGTGSGCIAITLALQNPDKKIIVTDISEDALDVAKLNVEKYGLKKRITLLQGDLLDPIKDLHEPFLLVSNPPYVTPHANLEPNVEKFEPHSALFSQEDGMHCTWELLKQAQMHPQCLGWVVETNKI